MVQSQAVRVYGHTQVLDANLQVCLHDKQLAMSAQRRGGAGGPQKRQFRAALCNAIA